MQETINRLRERPKEDRVAIATTMAVGIVVILLVGWFFFFMHSLGQGQLQYTRPAQDTSQDNSSDTAGQSEIASSSPTIVPVSTWNTDASMTSDSTSTGNATSAPASAVDGY